MKHDKEQRGKPEQETDKGLQIPIPKRGEFFRNLGKVAKTENLPTKGSAKQ